MGLSASQARLLTITSRKSDCEFQSMQLSHEKLSISRDLAILSNQYQASLNQTKLMYDYYGTGSGMEQLNYNTFMTPSALNDFRPITMTNSLNRVILDSRYASAAREAGIPQEGLGCSPSSDVRDKFAVGLLHAGLIDQSVCNSIQDTPYNQAAGLGSDGTSFETTIEYSMDEIYDLFLENSGSQMYNGIRDFNGTTIDSPDGQNSNPIRSYFQKDFTDAKGKGWTLNIQSFTTTGSYKYESNNLDTLVDITNSGNFKDTVFGASIYDLLNGDSNNNTQYYIGAGAVRGELTPMTAIGAMQHLLLDEGGILDWIAQEFTNTLGFNDKCLTAIRSARQEIESLLKNSGGSATISENDLMDVFYARNSVDDDYSQYNDNNCKQYVDPIGTLVGSRNGIEGEEFDTLGFTNHIGFVFTAGDKEGRGDDDGNDHTTAAININNIVKAFFTEFVNCMEGYENGKTYEIQKGSVEASELVTDDDDYVLKVVQQVEMDSSNSREVAFYDTLLNQIATSGWAENNEVHDPKYLQDMIENGMMYITNMSDDGFYYQRNYQTYSYVKEVSDESEIAKAEADYKANKEKLNMKEQKLDLKMKNLDTEISTLTTEYDTVKNLISKNIEKGFKRYSA